MVHYSSIPLKALGFDRLPLRKVAILFLFCLLTFQATAQQKTPAQFEIEVDPLAYILKGYSLHAAITYGSFRSSAGVFAIEQPSFFIDNDAFSVYSSGFDIKTDYLFGKINGWHSGVQVTYGRENVTLKETQQEQEVWGLSIGIRGGYRFMFGKAANHWSGLYINPWVAFIYSPDPVTITNGSQQYQQSSFSPFPAVHIGWRF